MPRVRRLLKARSALVALRAIGAALDGTAGVPAASDVVEAIDRLEASSGALALLRLQHLVLAGHLDWRRERAEVDRLCGTGAARAGRARRRCHRDAVPRPRLSRASSAGGPVPAAR